MREEWRFVPGYGNVYSVSNTGKVRNNSTGAILGIARLEDNGHCPVVRLFNDKSRKEVSIGKLVWTTFKGPVPRKHVIRCKVAGDFALRNLECVPRYTLTQDNAPSKRAA